jgi:chemotaxis protein methyltransferase CheR
VQRLHGALRDGGYLLLGHSETLWQLNDDFRLVVHGQGSDTAFVYQRPARLLGPKAPTPVRPSAPRAVAPAPTPQAAADPVAVVRRALASGRYGEAALLAAEAAEADPLDPTAHYLHGLALVEGGQDAQALPALRRAVYLDPDAGLPHFLLAGALSRLGDAPAAAREYRAAAATLGRRQAEAAAPELGGRRPADLAALCAELADRVSA